MGKEVKAYRDESNVNPNSNTETFSDSKIMIDNWRWNNVPFYVEAENTCTKSLPLLSFSLKKLRNILFQMKLPKLGVLTVNYYHSTRE